MCENPIHSFLLSKQLTKISECKLLLKLPRKDFFQGVWQIAISNISYTLHESINKFALIKSNFVIDTKFNANNEIEPFEPQLAFCLLKGNINDKKTINFEKTWFVINAISDTLQIKMELINQNDIIMAKKLDIFVTVLLQRLK